MDNDNSSIMDVILRNTKEALDIVQCPLDIGHRGGKANVQNYEVMGLLKDDIPIKLNMFVYLQRQWLRALDIIFVSKYVTLV